MITEKVGSKTLIYNFYRNACPAYGTSIKIRATGNVNVNDYYEYYDCTLTGYMITD